MSKWFNVSESEIPRLRTTDDLSPSEAAKDLDLALKAIQDNVHVLQFDDMTWDKLLDCSHTLLQTWINRGTNSLACTESEGFLQGRIELEDGSYMDDDNSHQRWGAWTRAKAHYHNACQAPVTADERPDPPDETTPLLSSADSWTGGGATTEAGTQPRNRSK